MTHLEIAFLLRTWMAVSSKLPLVLEEHINGGPHYSLFIGRKNLYKTSAALRLISHLNDLRSTLHQDLYVL